MPEQRLERPASAHPLEATRSRRQRIVNGSLSLCRLVKWAIAEMHYADRRSLQRWV
jgi:hypothetical protein